MKRDRRVFDASFKLEVARMVRDQGLGFSQVSQTMSVGMTALRRWVAQLGPERAARVTGVFDSPLLRATPDGWVPRD